MENWRKVTLASCSFISYIEKEGLKTVQVKNETSYDAFKYFNPCVVRHKYFVTLHKIQT